MSRFFSRVRNVAADDPGELGRLLFLFVGLPAALLLTGLIGPFQAADENAHYLRIIAITQGDILPVNSPPNAEKPAAGAFEDANAAELALNHTPLGGPKGHYSISDLRIASKLDPTERREFAQHSGSAIYPPLLYLASATGVWLARLAGLPVLWWLYIGRLANVLVASLIIQTALRRSGDAGLFLCACSLLPITIFQIATLSADALLFPLAIAFAVMVLRIQRGEADSKLECVGLAITTFVIAAGKVAYLPLAVLPAVATWDHDRVLSRRTSFFLLVAILTFLAWLAWALAVQDHVFSIRPHVEINAKAQLLGLLAHPIAGAVMLLQSMAHSTPKLVMGAVGRQLGWGDLILPAAIIYPLPFLLVGSALPAERPSPRARVLPIAAMVLTGACYFATFLLLYLQYNAVGAKEVVGVLGRYFPPLAIILLATTPRIKVSAAAIRWAWIALTAVSISTVATTLFFTWHRYWTPDSKLADAAPSGWDQTFVNSGPLAPRTL